MTTVSIDTPRYTTVDGASILLDVHADTVRRMINAGHLPHVRIGRAIRIPLDALTVDALASN